MIRELKNNVFWTGVFDPSLRVFDIIMKTEYGTTYNAYIIKGSEKTALVESTKDLFKEEYFQNVSKVTELKNVDYLIVNHTEPDHTGSIADILRINPKIQIVATPTAINFLKEITNLTFSSIPVKDGDKLSLGDKSLEFMALPNLHWPDTMYSYLQEDKILFTCDSFGSHYGAEKAVMRSEIQDEDAYLKAAKYYFDMILSPFSSFMTKALNRIETLPIDMICTGHGPVLDSKIPEFLETYKTWCGVKNPNVKPLVVIPFVSSYSYTEIMAHAIAKGVRSEGVDVHLYHLINDDCTNLEVDLLYAQGILIGSPTILSDALKPIYDLTTTMLPTTHRGKQAAAFGSYGWSGEAVANLTERLKQLRMKVSEGLRVKFKPSEEQTKECYAFGQAFAKKVKGRLSLQ